jgi:membrane-bound acyltransferase YfiQ involved in biofilm formation
MNVVTTNYIKGLAIIMVIMSHYMPHYFNSRVSFLGPLGVNLFLFLSAYGLCHSKANISFLTFLKKRLLKLFPEYYFGVIVLFIFAFIFTLKINSVKILLLFDLNWFFQILIFCYLFFYFSSKLNHKFIISLIMVLVFLYPETDRLWREAILSFPLGIFYFRNSKKLNKNSILMISLSLALFTSTFYLDYGSTFFSILRGISYALIISSLIEFIKWLKSYLLDEFLSYLGSNSYIIFVCHIVFLNLISVPLFSYLPVQVISIILMVSIFKFITKL